MFVSALVSLGEGLGLGTLVLKNTGFNLRLYLKKKLNLYLGLERAGLDHNTDSIITLF